MSVQPACIWVRGFGLAKFWGYSLGKFLFELTLISKIKKKKKKTLVCVQKLARTEIGKTK